MQDALQRQFVSVAYFPARKYGRLRARTVLPERLGLESVFEIGIGTDQKYFVSSFYILNKHFDGKYGITADAPCAVHRGAYGDFMGKLPHFQAALKWLDELQKNDFQIPEEHIYWILYVVPDISTMRGCAGERLKCSRIFAGQGRFSSFPQRGEGYWAA